MVLRWRCERSVQRTPHSSFSGEYWFDPMPLDQLTVFFPAIFRVHHLSVFVIPYLQTLPFRWAGNVLRDCSREETAGEVWRVESRRRTAMGTPSPRNQEEGLPAMLSSGSRTAFRERCRSLKAANTLTPYDQVDKTY